MSLLCLSAVTDHMCVLQEKKNLKNEVYPFLSLEYIIPDPQHLDITYHAVAFTRLHSACFGKNHKNEDRLNISSMLKAKYQNGKGSFHLHCVLMV